MIFDHLIPGTGVTLLKRQTLAVRPVAQQNGMRLIVVGPKNVCPQNQPIVHFDGHIPIDAHAVSDFR